MKHTPTPDNLVILHRAELVALMANGQVTPDARLPLARVARFFFTRVLPTNANTTLPIRDIWTTYQDFARSNPCATPPDLTAENFANQFTRLVMAYGSALQPAYQTDRSSAASPSIAAVTGPVALLPFDAPETHVNERIARAHAHLSQRLAARLAASSTSNVPPAASAQANSTAVSQVVGHLARIVAPPRCVIDGVPPTSSGSTHQRRRHMDRDRDC